MAWRRAEQKGGGERRVSYWGPRNIWAEISPWHRQDERTIKAGRVTGGMQIDSNSYPPLSLYLRVPFPCSLEDSPSCHILGILACAMWHRSFWFTTVYVIIRRKRNETKGTTLSWLCQLPTDLYVFDIDTSFSFSFNPCFVCLSSFGGKKRYYRKYLEECF